MSHIYNYSPDYGFMLNLIKSDFRDNSLDIVF